MRWMLLTCVLVGVVSAEDNEQPKTPPPPPEAILQRLWANRAQKDFLLKARLFADRSNVQPVELLVKNLPQEIRTIYRSENTQLLVVQSQQQPPRFYLAGIGELTTVKQRMERWPGSWISYYDLGLPFLYWPKPKYLGEDRMRGQDCYLLEARSDTEPYRRVKLWIHTQYFALLKAEAFDADENPVKRITITSFKRIGEVWVPRGMDFVFVPPGQALPASERSRLEIYEGNYDARLPLSDFEPSRFGAKPSSANN